MAFKQINKTRLIEEVAYQIQNAGEAEIKDQKDLIGVREESLYDIHAYFRLKAINSKVTNKIDRAVKVTSSRRGKI